MEDLINFIIVVVFVSVALVIKLTEAVGRKKNPPAGRPVPREPAAYYPDPDDFLEEQSYQRPDIKKTGSRAAAPARPVPVSKRSDEPRKPVVQLVKPQTKRLPLGRNELQKGIILSTILGKPRSLSKWNSR